ncbi:MAG: hypothetical protein Q4E58_06055 [Prevotellaceae bacterium]|nr:hypothetical protein [Prevotellaceae bacterium]
MKKEYIQPLISIVRIESFAILKLSGYTITEEGERPEDIIIINIEEDPTDPDKDDDFIDID